MEPIELKPIGHVRNTSQYKFEAPYQPDKGTSEVNAIELLPSSNFELALEDLDGFDHIWVISWFDRNTAWRPRVMPPRGPAKRRGVFSTRSPHRPNPIGMTCVPLYRINGLILEVGPLDLTDGTPVLDLKPYLRTVDCHPNSSLGWLESVVANEKIAPIFTIEISPKAKEQLDWLLENWNIDFITRACKILERDPMPHRTRRILSIGENQYRISCGAWRLYYQIFSTTVVVVSVGQGYSYESLTSSGNEKIIDRDAHSAFIELQSPANNSDPSL